MKYEAKRIFNLPQGGRVAITVGSDEPINEQDYRILQPQAALAMADWAIGFAEALKPSGAKAESQKEKS
jgi:hypothetical protein